MSVVCIPSLSLLCLILILDTVCRQHDWTIGTHNMVLTDGVLLQNFECLYAEESTFNLQFS